MELSKISTRYAKAIYDYASEKGEETTLNIELKRLCDVFIQMPEIKVILENPTLTKSQQEETLMAMIGGEISKTGSKVLSLIVENNRVSSIVPISMMYEKLFKKEKKIITTKLKSVKPISENAREQLISIIAKNNETVNFINQLDENLIGGFILEIEDQRLDASVKNQLNKIKKELIK